MRLIDADALFAEFENVGWYNNADRDEIAEPLILQSPTIDAVSVMHGEWIYGEHDVAMCDGYRCDKCGFFVPWDYAHKSIDFINDYHFCPNCGADMRGEKMNRYIDADVISRKYVIAELSDLADEFSELDENELHSERWCGITDAKQVVVNAPSIDIVRCKEYIHFDGFDCNRFGELAEYNNPCSDDGNDFCSYGERKESK